MILWTKCTFMTFMSVSMIIELRVFEKCGSWHGHVELLMCVETLYHRICTEMHTMLEQHERLVFIKSSHRYNFAVRVCSFLIGIWRKSTGNDETQCWYFSGRLNRLPLIPHCWNKPVQKFHIPSCRVDSATLRRRTINSTVLWDYPRCPKMTNYLTDCCKGIKKSNCSLISLK